MRNKKLIRKGQGGMTIVKPLQLKSSIINPSETLNKAAQSGMNQITGMNQLSSIQNVLGGQGGLGSLLGGQGGLGKQLLGSMGGVSGIAGMTSNLLGTALSKNAKKGEYQNIEEGLEGAATAALQFVPGVGQVAAPIANLLFKTSDNLAKSAGEDRFGNELVDSSIENIVNPVANISNTIGVGRDLLRGKIQLKDAANKILANNIVGKLAGIKDIRMMTAARQGEDYRANLRAAEQEIKQNRIEAQRRSQELLNDKRSAGWGTMYIKKGGKLPESCGCNKERDGLDTDVFYSMPKKLFIKVMKRVNLPEKTRYNDKIKLLIKNSVPKGSNLRSFIESIGDDVKEFIEHWENVRNKV